MNTARTSLKQAQLAYQKAVEDLEAAVIRSPIDGVVLDVPVKQGSLASSNAITANTLIATIADLKMPRVEVHINEADLSKVYVGQPAKIRIDALSQEWEGRVQRIDPKATESGNVVTFAVDVVFLDPPENLKEGLTADVDLIVNEKENVLWLPSFAIRSRGDSTIVMVKEGDKVVPKNVKIGISDGTRTEIISGVTEKSQVVMGSFDFINREASGNAGGNNRGNSPFGPTVRVRGR